MFLTTVAAVLKYIWNAILSFYKILWKKQIGASSGFYPQLLFQLESLRNQLNENNLLNINDLQKGNIYALIYNKETRQDICAGFHVPSNEELKESKELALQIKKTLNESENNVNPKNSNGNKWKNSQQVLFEFCEFIIQDSMREYTNIAKEHPEDNEYKHNVMCKKLVAAMDYIQTSIKNENF